MFTGSNLLPRLETALIKVGLFKHKIRVNDKAKRY